ncbi:hypothetical protein Sango_2985100 [Sesamum angolense]|uniref:Retroviral polymerase SH3-like domain-containing protein n=1 Tax=Sesamum angolense TaxID=2727404 RepID=A0AAE1T467_9LAMI|nr:hypothetical protein Sango_2985100 [Sesamum angolense]
MIWSMMSFTELPLSFWGYALETAARLLSIAPSKTMARTPYQIWHGKPASYKYLRVWGSPAYVKRLVGDKLDSRSSLCRFIGYPKETVGYYFYNPFEQKVFSQGMQCSWKDIFQRIPDAMNCSLRNQVRHSVECRDIVCAYYFH